MARTSKSQKKKNPSPFVFRFFKIMFGDGYSDVLYLPPIFVQKVQQFIGQHTLLVDSTGRQWPVKISSIDGYLAFKKGWHEFAIDHGLEVGHLLIFSYIKGGNFDVRIYGRSGREIVNFNSRRGIEKKKSRQGQEKILLKNPFGKVPNMETKSAQVALQAMKDMSSGLDSDVAVSFLLLEVKFLSYLELPIFLPPIEGENEGGHGLVVYLRDSASRLWPMLQTTIFSITSFSDGWKQFCEKNNVKTGDSCKLKHEKSIRGSIYRVDVIKKPVV
ncbi:B3 domain-containing protein Os02g0598200-like [Olea europaea var. sylvestris]|uniref:B3 domain-containing Os02g0598200-like n=1 Tax=Olea europaea subsp. europaea TaxID=158383 RepID=A0A8S0U152_OLEEU|nr:B3 domain-containing protein Os02g0598200-like [Olea europaea var. sylvestris]XP_022842419.1 B3 domain-containing protein Os02g0598200-like [Olea europaea var. sylvestris]XP_022842420.1 B3 domain-containing protein Os02g0598200-like [Olea europaea var. sylvestris]CAA3010973.1 B3 domain-containing Os02g0598200-like [Olea europaea subsp. europaea]